MRAEQIRIYFLLLLVAYFTSQCTIGAGFQFQDYIGEKSLRRLLHQPLFPENPVPPAVSQPPPPPPASPGFPDPDQPFFPEVPTRPTPDQVQRPPPAAVNGTAVPNPVAAQAQQSKPAKKVAIAISVGIVTLGMLSGLAFYLYKHRVKHRDESQKLVGGNSRRINEESRLPPSTFLYIGTVEPSTQRSVTESSGANGSPCRKLNSVKISDRYRPSPDLQPLPPLSKPPPPPSTNSPPPMSSSDEESHNTTFYTPQGSSVSNEEGSCTPSSRQSQPNNNTGLVTQPTVDVLDNSSVPHWKGTSPKSRLSASSADKRLAIIPSIKQPGASLPPPAAQTTNLEPQPQLSQIQSVKPAIPYAPKSATFSSPPPPPDEARLQLISGQGQEMPKAPCPPAPPLPPPTPPPPPPLLSTSCKASASLQDRQSAASPQREKAQSRSPAATVTSSAIEKIGTEEELNRSPSSSARHDADDIDGSKPKLKPLHWDKVRATSDRATVWDRLKSSSFQLNEDVMESLFGCNSANSAPKETTRKSVLPPIERENRVLDPKKSQNIAILLRALNVTRDEVSEALQDGNAEGLGSELLETLVKMAPTKEEEIKLKGFDGDTSRLGSAELFLKAILDVPFAFKRVESMLYRVNFDADVKYLRNSFQTLEEASEELKNSRLFLKLLEAVLRTGNRMNIGTNRGDARAFKLETLLKLVDIKGTDGKTTLLHFVVQEIIRSEGSASEPTIEGLANKANSKVKEDDFKKQALQVVAGLSRELGNVKKAAAMDSDVLSSYVSKLEKGLEKVTLVLQHEKPSMQDKYFESMKKFVKEAEDEILRIKAEEQKALSSVKDVTEYFHGDAAKEEAHPFRIFMIVRDFLSILDNVCKEVGRMPDRSMMVGTCTASSFRIPATASLPVLRRYNVTQNESSDNSLSP